MFAIKASEIPNLRISSRTERERSTRLIGLSTASLNNVKDIFKAHVTRHHDVYNRRGKHHQSGWDVDRIAQPLSGHLLGGLIGVSVRMCSRRARVAAIRHALRVGL